MAQVLDGGSRLTLTPLTATFLPRLDGVLGSIMAAIARHQAERHLPERSRLRTHDKKFARCHACPRNEGFTANDIAIQVQATFPGNRLLHVLVAYHARSLSPYGITDEQAAEYLETQWMARNIRGSNGFLHFDLPLPRRPRRTSPAQRRGKRLPSARRTKK